VRGTGPLLRQERAGGQERQADKNQAPHLASVSWQDSHFPETGR
jgi:hypothetical protein